jgi:putative tryptophan/tyrosine transport system substrate-binding protein
MRRREFITLLCSAAVAWPLSARAQQPARIPRIGFLGLGPASAWTSRVEALRQGLRDLGYIEGKNIVIEFRWADGVDQLAQFAAEFVRMNVDTASSTMVEAARQATKTIPIVFAYHAAPVGLGHVASLARPGGNITALANLLADLVAKDLEILMEALPQAKRVGVLWNPTNPSHQLALKAAETAGEKLGVKLVMVPARSADDFEGAFSTMSREGVTGLLVVSSPLSVSQSGRLAALALKYRLPGMFAIKIEVEAGGLMSYGADITDQFRRAALYIDKILKGVKPADLPMEQASKYQLVINLKTAKALGLTIPPTLLVRADEVIE